MPRMPTVSADWRDFERRNAQRRHRAVGQIVEALDVTVLDDRVADHRNGDGGLLQIGFAARRGDDDVTQPAVVLRRGLRGGIIAGGGIGGAVRQRGRSGETRRGDTKQQRQTNFGHVWHVIISLGTG